MDINNVISAFDGIMDSCKEVLSNLIMPLSGFLDVFSNFFVGLFVIAVVFAGLLIYCVISNYREFKNKIKFTKTLVISGLFIALNVVLGYFSIQFSSYLRIGFGFITLPVISALFGPLMAGMCGMAQDVISFVLKPTGGYIITYTLCVGISGMIQGLMLYKRKITLRRVFLNALIIMLVVNITLNTIALTPTAGKSMAALLPSRIVKNAIELPIHTFFNYIVLRFIKNIIKA